MAGASTPASIRHLAIVGTGLIGASVGLAARRAGVEVVTGYDADPLALAVAVGRGAVAAADTLAEAVVEADLVVVATPVSAVVEAVASALEASADSCTVTDVGSTKARVCAAFAAERRFVGGHPLSGSEMEGPAHADATLFEGATWFLVEGADPARYRVVHDFVASLGAVPVAIDPDEHDRLVALTSHLPHVLANVLANQVGGAQGGGALRDMTRVAGANLDVWLDVFLENREALAAALADHRRLLEEVEAALAAEDAEFLTRWIEQAAGNRRDASDVREHGVQRTGHAAEIQSPDE